MRPVALFPRAHLSLAIAAFLLLLPASIPAQPTVLEPGLAVRTIVSGLTIPTSILFLAANDILVLEKGTGQVKRVVNGVVQGVVLDLAVNFGSERGLLGIARDPLVPSDIYLFWTESTTGVDTSVISSVALLGNRVDRFVWNGSTLTFGNNVASLRVRQTDNAEVPGHPGTAEPTERGNNNGGVITFGSDGKLYVFLGDVGRRSSLQNLPNGPFATPPFDDDVFGGPEADDVHMTGVVLRLNPDGSAPSDNPFFDAGAAIGGEVGANVQQIFSYGHRNGFGMALDPVTNNLWLAENGDDAFSELNLVAPASNGGWIQIMGPVDRIAEFREIETTQFGASLQQRRWPPDNLATTGAEALSRLFVLSGSSYLDPLLAWKFEVSPGAIGFLSSPAFGTGLEGDLFVGAATPTLAGGFLFRIDLDTARTGVAVTDPRLSDGVADNLAKQDVTESESLLFGTNFGVVTDIETGPNGNLFVVSASNGAIYEIYGTSTGLRVPANRSQLRCQTGTGKALASFLRGKSKCAVNCLVDARKAGGPFTDCLPPFGGAAAACIQDAAKGVEGKARAKITAACSKDCPACYTSNSNCPSGDVFIGAAEVRFDALAPRLFCIEAVGSAPTKPEARCEDLTAKHLAKFVVSKRKCVAGCVKDVFKGKIAATCAAGTVTDPATLDCIAKAEAKAVAAIDEACAPPRGALPACHTNNGMAWVAELEAEVDEESPGLFCGP